MTRHEFDKVFFGLEKLFGSLPRDREEMQTLLRRQGYGRHDITGFMHHKDRMEARLARDARMRG